MPDSVFGCNINTILISRFGWFPAEHGAYFQCLFGIHPVSNNKSSLFQFCFTAHYATALKSFFPFTQLLHYFFQIPALLRNWMEQITQSYSSAIGKQGSVNYVLVGAFSQILSQCDPNPMVKTPSSHTARAIAFSSELIPASSFMLLVLCGALQCFILWSSGGQAT